MERERFSPKQAPEASKRESCQNSRTPQAHCVIPRELPLTDMDTETPGPGKTARRVAMQLAWAQPRERQEARGRQEGLDATNRGSCSERAGPLHGPAEEALSKDRQAKRDTFSNFVVEQRLQHQKHVARLDETFQRVLHALTEGTRESTSLPLDIRNVTETRRHVEAGHADNPEQAGEQVRRQYLPRQLLCLML